VFDAAREIVDPIGLAGNETSLLSDAQSSRLDRRGVWRLRILSWNIQWGLGLDGRVDLERIAAEIRRRGDPDVICLQEVTAGFDDLQGNDGTDQFIFFARAFPGHHAITAPVLDVAGAAGRRKLFGNMLLSRLAVGQIQRHTLPWLTVPERKCMPRGLIVATLLAGGRPLRIMTTHLEYSSPKLREAQVEAVREVHQQCCERVAMPPLPGEGSYAPQVETSSAIVLGDYNMTPDEAARHNLMRPFAVTQVPRFVDVFEVCHPGVAHPASMSLFDSVDGPPRCLDYAFCTENLTPRVVAMSYDQESRASDHQSIIVDLQL
jgi:endonuclease/exonuclease/phosphatase family metal-dependent hydrolase